MEPTAPDGLAGCGLQALHVGLLLFGDDIPAIQATLLPGMTVEALEAFHASVYAPSSARAHHQQLRAAGFQPGSLLSGNTRRRVLAKLPAEAMGPTELGDSVASLLTAYDACKLPLEGLVTGLVRRCGPADLVRAIYECLTSAGIDTELLSLEPARDAQSPMLAGDEAAPSAAPTSPAIAKPRPGAGAGGRRKCMCANCSATVSSVWRPGNANLLLCNACGMYFRKHGHQHRPEHMIASARSRAAAAAAGASSADGATGHKRCASTAPSDSEDNDESEDGGKPHRRRRRVQLTRWLADDYVLTDGLGGEPMQQDGEGRASSVSMDSEEEPDVSAASTLVAMSRCHLSAAERTRLAAAVSGCSSPGRVASPCSPAPMSRLAPSPFAAAAASPEPKEAQEAPELAAAKPPAGDDLHHASQAAATVAAAAAAPPSDWAYEQLDFGAMTRLALQLMPGLAAAVAAEHGSASGSSMAGSAPAGQQLYTGTDYGSSSCCGSGPPASPGSDGGWLSSGGGDGGDGRSPVRARARSRFAPELQDDKGTRRSPSRVDTRTASDGSPLWCDNCGVTETPLWRRDKSNVSRILCNACGIFKATSGKDRPTDGVFSRSRSSSPGVARRTPTKAATYQPYPSSKRGAKRAAPAGVVDAAASARAARPAAAPAGVLGVSAETALLAAAVAASSAAAPQGGCNGGILPFAIHPGAMAAGPLSMQQASPVAPMAGSTRADGLLQAAVDNSSEEAVASSAARASSLGHWAGSCPGSAVVREGSFAANNNCTSMAP